jgi:uncharacterized protein (TIGR01777 family)
MKVMVTGATGFIGKELIKRLNEMGHEIVVLTRNSDSARFRVPVHCEVITWDPCKYHLQSTALKGVDAVINLAGENIADGRWSPERKRELIQSRELSARRLVNAISYMDKKPKTLVSVSAIGFYGNRGDALLNETDSKGHGFLSDVCKVWEEEILKAKELRVRTVAYRLGMVLGHDGGALNKILPPFKLGLGGKLGSGSQWMSWIHINDLVNMLVHAIENPSIDGIYNAVSPNPVRNKEFTKTLGNVLNRPTIFPVPKFVLKIALGELSELLLGSQRVAAKKISDTGFKFNYPHVKEAVQEVCGNSYHEIQLEQWVPQPVNRTFSFFKEARNLEKITPKFLNFKILNQSTPEIQEGTKINYRLSLHGLPVSWISKITDWKPNQKFSDIQVKGPYSHWYHTHEFEEKNGGTLIKDHVLYKVPFGIPGDLVAGKWVRKDLEKVFTHRHKTIDTLLAN